MFKPILVILFSLFLAFSASRANTIDLDLPDSERMLSQLLRSISSEPSFSLKSEKNKVFIELFKSVLSHNEAFNYPFDSLVNVGKQKSSDNRVRIFTWNIPQPAGLQKYFGFLMINSPGGIETFLLVDRREEYSSPHIEIGSADKWFGALYYDIVTNNHNGENHYVLLGVDLNDVLSSKRVIEVVSIDKSGVPVFGNPIFRVGKEINSRVIFEYSSRATMLLRWDDTHKLIVCSHLIPMRPSYTGKFQFYVPDLSYDGFMYNGNYWEYTPDIDIRNPSRRRPPSPVAPTEENYDPGFLYRSGRGNQVR